MSSHGMAQGSRRLTDAMAAVLGVARTQIARGADLAGLNRWIGARVVDLLEGHRSRRLVEHTCASGQQAMVFDLFPRIRMMDRRFCQDGCPSGT